MLYFADTKWWKWHREKPEFEGFQGQKVSIQNTGSYIADANVDLVYDMEMLLNDGVKVGLSRDPRGLRTGSNSGYQAVGLAFQATGAAEGVRSRCILLGFDMRYIDGRTHWFGDHPLEGRSSQEQYTHVYAPYFAQMNPPDNFEVLNATPGSYLKCFPAVDLREVLP